MNSRERVLTALEHRQPDQVPVNYYYATPEVVGQDGGLILAPAHAMQPDTPVDNALALYEAAGGMTQ